MQLFLKNVGKNEFYYGYIYVSLQNVIIIKRKETINAKKRISLFTSYIAFYNRLCNYGKRNRCCSKSKIKKMYFEN